jgi:hypothetical protein
MPGEQQQGDRPPGWDMASKAIEVPIEHGRQRVVDRPAIGRKPR